MEVPVLGSPYQLQQGMNIGGPDWLQSEFRRVVEVKFLGETHIDDANSCDDVESGSMTVLSPRIPGF